MNNAKLLIRFFYMLLLRNFFELHRKAGKEEGIKQSKIGHCNCEQQPSKQARAQAQSDIICVIVILGAFRLFFRSALLCKS